MATRYGVQDLMRRVQCGSIMVRKDKDGEWEFMFSKETKYEDEKHSTEVTVSKGGHAEQDSFLRAMGKSDSYHTMISNSAASNLDPELCKFFQDKGAKANPFPAPALSVQNAPETSGSKPSGSKDMDSDVLMAEQLSQAGSAGKAGKDKVNKFLDLLDSMKNSTSDTDQLSIIKNHQTKLKKFNVPGTKFKLDDVKETLTNAAKAVRRLKDM